MEGNAKSLLLTNLCARGGDEEVKNEFSFSVKNQGIIFCIYFCDLKPPDLKEIKKSFWQVPVLKTNWVRLHVKISKIIICMLFTLVCLAQVNVIFFCI